MSSGGLANEYGVGRMSRRFGIGGRGPPVRMRGRELPISGNRFGWAEYMFPPRMTLGAKDHAVERITSFEAVAADPFQAVVEVHTEAEERVGGVERKRFWYADIDASVNEVFGEGFSRIRRRGSWRPTWSRFRGKTGFRYLSGSRTVSRVGLR